MARRGGLLTAISRAARYADQAALAQARARDSAIRNAEREARARDRAVRDAEREQRATERARVADERERKRQYVEDRMAEVQELNDDLARHIGLLEGLLKESLGWNPAINFETLKVKPKVPALDLGGLQIAAPAPEWSQFAPNMPNPLFKWFPAVRKGYEARVADRQRAYQDALEVYRAKEVQRREACEKKIQEHKALEASIRNNTDQKNAEIDRLREAVVVGEREALETYFDNVLGAGDYPEGFSQDCRLVFMPESKQLAVEYDLPLMDDVVPSAKGFTYVKATDDVRESPMPDKQRRSLYTAAVAQTTLRCLREVFAADLWGHVETIAFSGFVSTTDPGTGKPIRPCLVSLRVTQDRFMDLNLSAVDPVAALQNLSASFSKSPAELAPVRPILDLNMVDPRFIQETDVLSTLDLRPNLMDLSPGEFESLITNLFTKMGLETRLTQASRDGGVDCVAFDPRPIFGGKVVIQAKRYKNTVGVSAVRDLFGTIQNEGASKGILVATSGYGKAAFEFANGKPMELLDGGNLLHLLKEHAGIDARIVMPEDWRDLN